MKILQINQSDLAGGAVTMLFSGAPLVDPRMASTLTEPAAAPRDSYSPAPNR